MGESGGLRARNGQARLGSASPSMQRSPEGAAAAAAAAAVEQAGDDTRAAGEDEARRHAAGGRPGLWGRLCCAQGGARWRERGLIAVGTGKFVRLRIAEVGKMRSRACRAVAAADDAAGTRQMMLVLVEAGSGVGRAKVAGRQEVLQLPLCSFWQSRRLSSRLTGAGGCGRSRARVCLPGLLLSFASHKVRSSVEHPRSPGQRYLSGGQTLDACCSGSRSDGRGHQQRGCSSSSASLEVIGRSSFQGFPTPRSQWAGLDCNGTGAITVGGTGSNDDALRTPAMMKPGRARETRSLR
jgi:hypothetical protein